MFNDFLFVYCRKSGIGRKAWKWRPSRRPRHSWPSWQSGSTWTGRSPWRPWLEWKSGRSGPYWPRWYEIIDKNFQLRLSFIHLNLKIGPAGQPGKPGSPGAPGFPGKWLYLRNDPFASILKQFFCILKSRRTRPRRSRGSSRSRRPARTKRIPW